MRYQIQGETLPVVICELEGGETMITEGGGMAWMSPNTEDGDVHQWRRRKSFWPVKCFPERQCSRITIRL